MPTSLNMLNKSVEVTQAMITEAFLDVTGPGVVQVLVDMPRGVLHVNVNGICLLRICQVQDALDLELIKRGMNNAKV